MYTVFDKYYTSSTGLHCHQCCLTSCVCVVSEHPIKYCISYLVNAYTRGIRPPQSPVARRSITYVVITVMIIIVRYDIFTNRSPLRRSRVGLLSMPITLQAALSQSFVVFFSLERSRVLDAKQINSERFTWIIIYVSPVRCYAHYNVFRRPTVLDNDTLIVHEPWYYKHDVLRTLSTKI